MSRLKTFFSTKTLFKNPLPKFICLLLAIVSWFIVMDYENPIVTRTFKDMEIKIIGQENLHKRGLIIQNIAQDKVDVEIKGRWSNVMQVDESSITTQVDVAGYDIGKALIPISSRSTDASVSIKGKTPSKVEFTFDKISTVEKSVKIVTKGKLKEGLELGNLESYNKKINVKGPLSIIKNIAYLEAEISLEDKEKSFVENVKLIPKDSEGNVIETADLEAPILDVYVPIFIERDVKIRVNTKGQINEDYKASAITVEPSIVKIRGDSDKVNKIDFVNTDEIDIEDLKSSVKKEVKLKLDKDIQLLEKAKVFVTIDLKPKETKRISVPASQITIKGKNSSYKYTVDPLVENVDIDLIDIRDNIINVNKSDVKLEVDVKNLKPGEYKLPILLRSEKEKKLTSDYIIEPKQIIINIK